MKVKCINADYSLLTLGLIYEVKHDDGKYYTLITPEGSLGWLKTRFEVVTERVLLGYRIKTPSGKYVHYGAYLAPLAKSEKPPVHLTKLGAVSILMVWLQKGWDGRLVKVYRKAT